MSRSESSKRKCHGPSIRSSISCRRSRKLPDSRPITSLAQRSKKTAWRISSTSWVARKASTSPLGAASRNGRQVGGDPLLADVEAADAEGGVPLRLGGADQPVLAVDREVELVRAPVLPLPERVELLVAHQPALRAPALGRIAGVAGGAVGCHLAAPASGVLGLDAALALLALELRAVDTLGPVDPASEPGDRRDAGPRPRSCRVSSRRTGSARPRAARASPSSGCRTSAVGVLAEAALDPHGAVVDLDAPGSPSLADQLVGDGEAVARASTRARSRTASERKTRSGSTGMAEPGQVARPGVGIELAESEGLAAAPAQLQPAAHQRADRVAAGGDPRERLGVGRDREGLAIEIGAGERPRSPWPGRRGS